MEHIGQQGWGPRWSLLDWSKVPGLDIEYWPGAMFRAKRENIRQEEGSGPRGIILD